MTPGDPQERLADYRAKRDFAVTAEPSGTDPPPDARPPVRRPASPGQPAPLRPAPRDRRRPRQLGGAEGADARPGRPAPRRARRGPPARLLRLRGRDPGRRVRRRRRHRLGLGHVGPRRGRRSAGRRRRRAICTSTCTARSCAGRFVLVRPRRAGERRVAAAAQARRRRRRRLGSRGPPPLGQVRPHQRRGPGRPGRATLDRADGDEPTWDRRRPTTSWPRSTPSARTATWELQGHTLRLTNLDKVLSRLAATSRP